MAFLAAAAASSQFSQEAVGYGGWSEAGASWDGKSDPLLDASPPAERLGVADPTFYSLTRPHVDLEAASETMKDAVLGLKALAEDSSWEPVEEEGWQELLQASLPDPADFKAGTLGAHWQVVEEFFRISGNDSQMAKRVVTWLREGVYCPFTDANSPGQLAAPFARKKREIVTAMLEKALPKGSRVEEYLQGDKPKPVSFPNHRSTAQYASFVTEEVASMLEKGVVKEWGAAEPPVLVNGLRVVDDRAPKLRLCINPMYLNLFLKHSPLRYEHLGDLVHLADEGDLAFTTDDKSGYWQCPMHPAMWKYLAFSVGGKLYCFTHMPFGIAPACFIYSTIKQEIFRPLREWGLRLVFYIDDQISLQRGRGRAAMHSQWLCKLLASLGFILSVPKCQMDPAEVTKFLGLLVDLGQRQFSVPAEKAEQLEQLLLQAEKEGRVSDRTMARWAGKLMALAPALELAPLLARDVLKAMQGTGDWDEVYQTPTALLEDGRLTLELMKLTGGRRWEQSGEVIQVVGDASDYALAAFTPNGELGAPMVVPFSDKELRETSLHRLSSTARELKAVQAVVTTLAEQLPGGIKGKVVQYFTDSQPAMVDLMRMKGNEATFPIVRETRLRCAELGAALEVRWRPRSDAQQVQADALSKVVDETDWVLNQEVYKRLLASLPLQGRSPTLDAFASATNTKVPGAFFARHWGPGCSGVDAYAQDWGRAADTADERGLVWVNGPFQEMGRILKQVAVQRVDAIIVAPVWPRPWAALWRELPVKAAVDLPHRRDLFLPGALVPKGKRAPKAPRYKVRAYLVVWD